MAMAGRPLVFTIAGEELRASTASRPFILGAVATAVLVLMSGRRRVWPTRLLVLAYGVIALMLVAVPRVATWPVADSAMTELYTIHALDGAQLLGPYSQYGWHHPGPMMFYLLAPTYVLAGFTPFGLNAGALLINLGAMVAIGWVLRRSEASALLAGSLCTLLMVYVLRLPGLVTSAWNPHLAILPFTALLLLAAAGVRGDARTLPLIAIFASFVAQTHVSFAPIGVLLGLAAAIGVWRHARRHNATVALERPVLVTTAILLVLWLLPLAEQIAHRPGNATQILAFFGGGDGQPFAAAWPAWSSMLVGLLRPGLTMALGNVYVAPPSALPLVGSLVALAALAAIAWPGGRPGRSFEQALAIVCLITAALGAWSALQIRGPIGDYHLFWLSALGTVIAALIAASLLRLLTRSGPLAALSPWTVRATTAVLTIGVAANGLSHIQTSARTHRPDRYGRAVQSLAEQTLNGLPSTGNNTPLVDLGPGMWPYGSGLVLQLARASVDFSMDREESDLFGWHLAPNGREDVLLTISDATGHLALARRRGNVVLAHDEESGVYVDALSLIDQPEYRYRR